MRGTVKQEEGLATASNGQAWLALLAQAEANRDQARVNSQQALANHVTARALMLAMQTQCDPSACALQCDELHCWYNDAEDVAEVARRVASGTAPHIDLTAVQVCECRATERVVRGLEVQVEVECSGTAPTTP